MQGGAERMRGTQPSHCANLQASGINGTGEGARPFLPAAAAACAPPSWSARANVCLLRSRSQPVPQEAGLRGALAGLQLCPGNKRSPPPAPALRRLLSSPFLRTPLLGVALPSRPLSFVSSPTPLVSVPRGFLPPPPPGFFFGFLDGIAFLKGSRRLCLDLVCLVMSRWKGGATGSPPLPAMKASSR